MPKDPEDRKMKLPPKQKRNPHARALASPLFRNKVEEKPAAYKRKPKHPPPIIIDDEDA